MEWKDKLRIMKSISLGFRQSELYKNIMDKAVSEQKGKRGGRMYNCTSCCFPFLKAEVQVDHIVPIISGGWTKRTILIGIFISRVYCDKSNLQVLCKPCHLAKTNG